MRKKDKKADNRLLEFVEEQSDMSPASIANIPYIQLSGQNYAEIEGIYKLLECNNNTITFKFKKHSVCFSGEGLFIKNFTDKSAVIKGKIIRVEFL